MATTGATGSTRVDTPRANGIRARIAERNHETKAAFKTTEFWAMIVLVVTILVSAALINGGDNGTDEFIAKQAWLYVAITIAAYAWLPVAVALGLPIVVALAGVVPVPIAIWRAIRVADHRNRDAFEQLTFFAVFLLVATAICELVAFSLLA